MLREGTEVQPSLGLQTLMAHFGVKSAEVRVRPGDTARELAASRFTFKGLGSVSVKGKAGPSGLSELIDEKVV